VTPEIALAFAILFGALIAFMMDVVPIDFVAFSIMALMLVLGPILGVSPQEAISGFSNPATITILAMFILSAGIYRTGIINRLAHYMVLLSGDSQIKQLLVIMLVVGPISAFINNTAAVAILIPSVITMARSHNQAPSKLLIPLSYFSQLAGAITLIGTATNVLASSISAQHGYGTFGMFEFSHIGILILITGAIYILTVGRHLLPDRRLESEFTEDYHMQEYLTDVIVLDDSPLVGKSIVESRLREQFDTHVLDIVRDGHKVMHPIGDEKLEPWDILFIKTQSKQLFALERERGLAIEPELRLCDESLESSDRNLLEVVIGPNSPLIGTTLESTNFRQRYNSTVIAIRRHGEVLRERLGRINLNFGDTLLLRGAEKALSLVKYDPSFIIVTEELRPAEFRHNKVYVALGIIAGVVIIAALGTPILVTSIVGCVLMVVTGCLDVSELHEAIRWDVIFLLAGIIPLGLALERTGGAQLLADLATLSADYVPPVVVLMIFYLVTVFMAEFISHSAAVVVMIPVGAATAEALGLDARAFILASMFAASMSFSTPVGYQTNTMIYGPGGYKFFDFTRIGAPFSLLMAITTPIYIYLFWGL
jgi:di/tricarboxylate transporter